MTLTFNNARSLSEAAIHDLPPYPDKFSGRGIVICGGGVKYFTNAWVCINMLRQLGCSLPIQLWHLGQGELDHEMEALVKPLGVHCVEGGEVRERFPRQNRKGWQLKPYSIVNSPFQEVLFLDADNVPVTNPEFLFDTIPFKETGAIFWPDLDELVRSREIWSLCGVEYRNEPAFETGQILVDKRRCWKALLLCLWYNRHADFYYQYSHGDTATFHMAFRKVSQSYSMPDHPVRRLKCTMCQHDFDGNRIFQHRNMDKWSLHLPNQQIEGFLYEDACRNYLESLKRMWAVRLRIRRFSKSAKNTLEIMAAERLFRGTFLYQVIGFGHKPLRFLPNGMIGLSPGGNEVFWDLIELNGQVELHISSEDTLTARLTEVADGAWTGEWLVESRLVKLSEI